MEHPFWAVDARQSGGEQEDRLDAGKLDVRGVPYISARRIAG